MLSRSTLKLVPRFLAGSPLTEPVPLDADMSEMLRPASNGVSLSEHKTELEALYKSHFGKLVGYFMRRGCSDAAARDLAQDSFVNAWRGLAQFRGGSKLSTWLWTVARNAHLAQVRTHKPTDFTALDAEGEPIDPDSLSESRSEALTAQQDCVRRGFAAFHRDHPERAQIVYLAVVEGWTREELAEFLDRTPHAATEYLSQCRAKFKPYIECCNDD